MAWIGIIQLILWHGFKINFINQQPGRISGFCYEPSYYVTYMIMGFVSFAYMLIKKNYSVFSYRELKHNFRMVALAMLLSTSRMGFIMMFLWYCVALWLDERDRGIFSFKKLLKIFRLMIFGVIMFFVLLVMQFVYNLDFLGGLGFEGHASHSRDDRLRGQMANINLFLKSPLIGYSLGGVDPANVQAMGRRSYNMEHGTTINVWAEMLAASGIIGIIPLILYFFELLFSRGSPDKNKCQVMKALQWGLFFGMLILGMNQNILRPYFWWHIAILSACYKHNRKTFLESCKIKKL